MIRENNHRSAYVRGLFRAYRRGEEAGANPDKTYDDNPYRGRDHRACWVEGFIKARLPMAQPQ